MLNRIAASHTKVSVAWSTLLSASLLLCATEDTVAAVMVAIANGTEGTFSASTTDLINSDQPTFAGPLSFVGNQSFTGSDPANINNGVVYSGSGAGSTFESFNPTTVASPGDDTLTITLNTTTMNSKGYNITSVVSLTGSSARAGQGYTMSWSLVGNPGFEATSVTVNAPEVAFVEKQVTISEDTTGVIASGVDQLRFVFFNPSGGGFFPKVYREIDVFGSAVITPEPSSAALAVFGLASFGFIGRRWRRRT